MAKCEKLLIHIDAAEAKLSDCLTQEEKESSGLCETGAEMHKAVGRYIRRVIEAYENSFQRQVVPVAFTDVLYYVYGEWTVKITASNNCPDLKERISQNSLDRSNLKCRDTYRPVLIARDGLPVFDQAESLEGYCRFLKDINPDLDAMPKEQQGIAKPPPS